MARNALLWLLMFVEKQPGLQSRPLLSTDASLIRDRGRVKSPQCSLPPMSYESAESTIAKSPRLSKRFVVGWGWVSGGVDPTDAGSECDKIGARRCLSRSLEN
jgi:hypothetical protein